MESPARYRGSTSPMTANSARSPCVEDGAVFFVDEEDPQTVHVLGGRRRADRSASQNGAAARRFTRTVNGIQDVDVNDWAKATAPVILADGTTTVVSSRANSESHLISKWNGSYWDVYPDSSSPGSEETHVDLVSVASDSLTPSALELTVDASIPTGLDLSAWRIIPRPNGRLCRRRQKRTPRCQDRCWRALGHHFNRPDGRLQLDMGSGLRGRSHERIRARQGLLQRRAARRSRDVRSCHGSATGQQQLLSPDARLRFIQADDGVHVSGSTYGGVYDANDTRSPTGCGRPSAMRPQCTRGRPWTGCPHPAICRRAISRQTLKRHSRESATSCRTTNSTTQIQSTRI